MRDGQKSTENETKKETKIHGAPPKHKQWKFGLLPFLCTDIEHDDAK
jgi:hypothetical protein